jgi:hypothetical protein
MSGFGAGVTEADLSRERRRYEGGGEAKAVYGLRVGTGTEFREFRENKTLAAV